MADPSRALAADYSERAAAYVRYWAPVIHPMAHPLLATMSLAGARRIIDVGTGSGGLWPVIQAAAPGARLYGAERARGMLRAGGALLRNRVAVMDAEHLGVRREGFDAALLLFVLFHVPDPVASLREVRAVLCPGGLVGLVVWGVDPGLPGATIWAEELDRAGAIPDPRDPAVMRHALMDTPDKLSGLMRQADLTPADVWSRRFMHEWTVERLIATQSHCGLPSRRLSGLSPESRRACTDRVRARFEALTPAELTYEVEVVYGIGNRAG